MKTNIHNIAKSGMCHGCGTCAGICPNEAFRMVPDGKKGIYIPQVDRDKCNQCGLCQMVCPRNEVKPLQVISAAAGEEFTQMLLGDCINSYLGQAADYDIRYNSSSGGLVTALLIFALDNGIIDGALVTRMKHDNPFEPEPFIARTREEIVEASKSKYCPVAANTAIKTILDQEGNYAVVGLPCHIQGIRKAEAINGVLKKRIVLHLGIFCSHTDTFEGSFFMLRKLGKKLEEVHQIAYRGEGWPGKITIKSLNGNEISSAIKDNIFVSMHNTLFFTPTGCLTCSDVTAEGSDISFGDAWLPEIVAKEHVGKSVFVVRSKTGRELLEAATHLKVVEITEMKPSQIIKSQRTFLHFKKINLVFRKRIMKGLSREYKPEKVIIKASSFNYLVAFLAIFHSSIGSVRFGRRLLKIIPAKMLCIYISIFYSIYSRIMTKDFDRK
jgi:coenzyme F420 hydrogenase subunit beta